MGFRGIPSADLYFDEVRVPAENLVVEAGGFKKLFGVFSIERLGNSTMSLAIGQASLDRAKAYVEHRQQFGRALIEFQNTQMVIADMAMQVEASRLLIYRAAINAGNGLPAPLEVSLAKCFANEMGKRVSDLAMQLHGGNGFSEEYGIERLHRDSHGWAIAGGTPAIQRVRIASELYGRSFDQRPPRVVS
jgi:butyryl-CoA dehydrogenase